MVSALRVKVFLILIFFRGRKMNTHLESAIQEAMMELDRQDIQPDEPPTESIAPSQPVRSNKTSLVKKRRSR